MEPYRVLSLGAGVQSSTLALMAARGEVGPMPDAAIFADTQWEPAAVYRWLDWLEKQLPFPVYRVTAGNLRADLLAKTNTTGQRFAAVPFFTLAPDGKRGMGQRQCTKEYKLQPIRREARRLMLAAGKTTIEQWIGISCDEVVRMKLSGRKYITNRWPLVEAGMARWDCLRWMEERQYPKPVKSACLGCPYHSNSQWRDLRDNDPEGWADTVEVDRAIRVPGRGIRAQQFMHASCVPLDQVDLSTAAERGQPDLFADECDGICGT